MSEEALNRFLERWNTDEEFQERMRTDWEDAIDELGLSQTELVAISTGDEDALRRLAGAEVTGYSLAIGALGWTPYCTGASCRAANTMSGCVPPQTQSCATASCQMKAG